MLAEIKMMKLLRQQRWYKTATVVTVHITHAYSTCNGTLWTVCCCLLSYSLQSNVAKVFYLFFGYNYITTLLFKMLISYIEVTTSLNLLEQCISAVQWCYSAEEHLITPLT